VLGRLGWWNDGRRESQSVHEHQRQRVSKGISVVQPLRNSLTVHQAYPQPNRCPCCDARHCSTADACSICYQGARDACQYDGVCDICKLYNREECNGAEWCNNCQAYDVPSAYCRKSCFTCFYTYYSQSRCDGGHPICSQCMADTKAKCDGARAVRGPQ
jgi:hypothetical protein